jgi:single-strand DNA-binding protein
MSGSLNKVQLIGRLGRDPEARNLQGGGRVVNLRIATSESWRGSDGERRERTEWHQVSIWNEGLGDIVEKYLRKGALVYVEGKLHTSK